MAKTETLEQRYLAPPVESTPDEQRNFPQIEFSEDICSDNCPYIVEVYPEKAAEVLKLAGVPEEEIADVKITITRRLPEFHRGLTTNGNYNATENRISLAIDPFWNSNVKWQRRAREIISETKFPLTRKERKQEKRNQFEEFTSGERLSRYLSRAPKERAEKIAEKLIDINTSKRISNTFVHEAQHAADITEETAKKYGEREELSKKIGELVMGGLGGAIGITMAELLNSKYYVDIPFGLFYCYLFARIGPEKGWLINYKYLDKDEKKS